MEFTIDRCIFLEIVQNTLGIIERKASLPILAGLRINAENGKIRISATDREISLIQERDAEFAAGGEIVLPGRKLAEILREFADESVHLAAPDPGKATITCGGSVFQVFTLPAGDFPTIAEPPSKAQFFTVGTPILAQLIRLVSPAICDDASRPNLNGVFLEKDLAEGAASLRMVATDGHRLAMACLKVADADIHFPDKGVIIPRKGLAEIRKFIENEPGDLRMAVGDASCILMSGRATLHISLVDGTYPDWRRVVPVKGESLRMDRGDLLAAMRRMRIVNPDYVSMDFSEGALSVSSTHPDVGETRERVLAAASSPDVVHMEAKYNVRYLIDALGVMDGNGLDLQICGNVSPGVLRSAENDSSLHIVMPLKM